MSMSLTGIKVYSERLALTFLPTLSVNPYPLLNDPGGFGLLTGK